MKHTVGIVRQFCEPLSKTKKRRVAARLLQASETASLPIAWRLYFPEESTSDRERSRQARMVDEIGLAVKNDILLAQVKQALAVEVEPWIELANPIYGNSAVFRNRLIKWRLAYPKVSSIAIAESVQRHWPNTVTTLLQLIPTGITRERLRWPCSETINHGV